jgi:hypothetical protein
VIFGRAGVAGLRAVRSGLVVVVGTLVEFLGGAGFPHGSGRCMADAIAEGVVFGVGGLVGAAAVSVCLADRVSGFGVDRVGASGKIGRPFGGLVCSVLGFGGGACGDGFGPAFGCGGLVGGCGGPAAGGSGLGSWARGGAAVGGPCGQQLPDRGAGRGCLGGQLGGGCAGVTAQGRPHPVLDVTGTGQTGSRVPGRVIGRGGVGSCAPLYRYAHSPSGVIVRLIVTFPPARSTGASLKIVTTARRLGS